MTNYGAIAILGALPETAPARQVRVLIALETFKADSNGWRAVGAVQLAETANVSRSTLKRARPELIAEKLVSYIPGMGRGSFSRYRINIADLKKGPGDEPLSEGVPHTTGKGSTDGQKRVHPPGKKGSTDKTGNSSIVAGQPPVLNGNSEHAALGAKAPALKAGAFSSPANASAPEGARQSLNPGTSPMDLPVPTLPPTPCCQHRFTMREYTERARTDDHRTAARQGRLLCGSAACGIGVLPEGWRPA